MVKCDQIKNNDRVRVGSHLVDLDAVASAHWEGHKLFVYLVGGRWITLDHADGQLLWDVLANGTIDLATGEVLTSRAAS